MINLSSKILIKIVATTIDTEKDSCFIGIGKIGIETYMQGFVCSVYAFGNTGVYIFILKLDINRLVLVSFSSLIFAVNFFFVLFFTKLDLIN